MKERIPQITFEQLAEMAPTVKSQIRAGFSTVKPGYKIVEVNQTTEDHLEESDEEEEDTRKTSAYAICRIENLDVEAIIDTGAGGCIVSKNLLNRLGWGIDRPTKKTIIVADGVEATPLGEVCEIR